MADVACTRDMTPDAMEGHKTGIAKVVNLCASFIFTSGSQREEREKGRALSFELRPSRRIAGSRRDPIAVKHWRIADCAGGKANQ
jgi:hypothetical protein